MLRRVALISRSACRTEALLQTLQGRGGSGGILLFLD
jgi:hypothetical protein